MSETEVTREHVTQEHKKAPTSYDLQKKLRGSRILNLILALALVFVGGAYAALVYSPNTSAAAPQTAGAGDAGTAGSASVVDAELLSATPYMVLGDPNAPITLYEWTDFTCPYCGVFNRETLPELVKDYIDTGKVRLEVHDVTFIGAQAEDAAVAARAAGVQGSYFEFLFAIYELGRNDNRPDLSRTTLFQLAQNLGLDMARFETDFDGTVLRQDVQASTQKAQSLGISSVPFFVAAETGTLEGLQNVQGAQPLETFATFLDQQVARATS